MFIGGEILIYDNIKQLCKEQGISIKSVEEQANLSNGAISKWGKSIPSATNLQTVAKILKTSVENLLRDQYIGR